MMLNFDKELERFKPMLNVDHIEEQLAQDTLEDIMDVLKNFQNDMHQDAYNIRKEG